MEIKKDAKTVRIEPAENGLIVYLNSTRDPYNEGEVSQRMVFASVEELSKFLTEMYVVKKKFTTGDLKEMHKDIYSVEDEVFGGGS